MANKSADMQVIFNELSEENKDIMILIARSMKVAQGTGKQVHKTPKQSKVR